MFTTRGAFPYFIELFGLPVLFGSFILLLAFPFALIAVAVIALAAVVGAVVLVVAIVVAPVWLLRAAHRRWLATAAEPAEEIAYSAHATVRQAA